MLTHTLLAVIAIAVGVVAVTALARRIRFSAPLLLVAVGVAVALVPVVPEVRLDPHIVLYVLLPPLLYGAALNSSLIAVRRNVRPIGLLAVALPLVTALAVGGVTYMLLHNVTFAAALALGAVVAPPDAVAATAVARRAGLPRRLLTILEGESLFDDATALVTLSVALAAVDNGMFSPGWAVLDFLRAGVGGAVIGVLAGLLVGWLRRRRIPALVETALSLVTPFGIYLAGEEAGTSGVIAVVVTGLILAHRSPVEQMPEARLTDTALWSTVQLLLEGGVFMLIGLELPAIVSGVGEPAGTVLVVALAVLLVVLLVRPAWVFGLTYLAGVVPWSDRGKPPAGGLAVISWAGMRGVVSLAAAQILPLGLPHRNLFVLIAMVVILGTLGMQGMTLPRVIRWVGVLPPDPRQDALQVARAQQRAAEAAKQRLREIGTAEDLPERMVAQLCKQLDVRANWAWERLGEQTGETPAQLYVRLRREMVAAEREVLISQRDSGELEEELLRDLQRRLDFEDSLLPEVEEDAGEAAVGHQDMLPQRRPPACADLRDAPSRVPDADPRECPDCVAAGFTDWVHVRICLSCGKVGCCDSSPRRHAQEHARVYEHPVMGSGELGEQWRWCYRHHRVG